MNDVDKKSMDSHDQHKDNIFLKINEAETNKIKISDDDPFRRIIETTSDIDNTNQLISLFRLKALEHARKMPTSYDNVSSILNKKEEQYIYSQKAVPRKSNWLQIGPTAIANGQTASTYYNYANMPALIAGRITSIVPCSKDKDIIYIGTALGGVWKTTDGGRNWIPTSDYAPSLGIGSLVMDPQNHNILYAGTGEGNLAWMERKGQKHPYNYYGCGILKTVDGGGKWELIGDAKNVFNGASFYRIVIDPNDSSIIYAATTYGLFRSNNAGKEWSQMTNGLSSNKLEDSNKLEYKATDVIINPSDSNIVYVAIGENGIYKTENAKEGNPLWKECTIEHFNKENSTRIGLAISNSSPNIIYALIASVDRPFDENYEDLYYNDEQNRRYLKFIVDQFYISIDEGKNWKRIPLPGIGTKDDRSPWFIHSIGGQGYYDLNVAVHPSNPDIVFLSGVSLWKATRDASTDKWDIRDIGIPIHPDHHAFAFDNFDLSTIYAGSDGGLYKSNNGGETWSDTINEGFCITQFEVIDQHPTSDAMLFGGTQDNGTLQYRNSPAFYFSDYGDGGFVAIDKDNPNNVVHQYTYWKLFHSKQAGQIDSWKKIYVLDNDNKPPSTLFYAPFALDQENSKNIAYGSDRIFLDKNQGLGRWKTQVGEENSIKLPFLDKDENRKPTELVSAINFVNSSLIYAGTTNGKVIRAIKTDNDGNWKVHLISNNHPLPKLYVWDIATIPNNLNEIVIIMAGWGSEEKPSSNIWCGTLSRDDNKSFVWHPINGTGISSLPETPINALVIDDTTPTDYTIYIGTDIGVFKSTNKGESWIRFSENLPVCAVYDMKLHTQARKLRIATHGRGIWERNLDTPTYNDVNIFVRNHLMDTESINPSDNTTIDAAFSDPLQDENGGIKLYDELSLDMCPDIKIDSPRGDPSFYQFEDIDDVDYVKFETRLQHRNPKRNAACNIFVQIHNKGITSIVKEASVKLFYANPLPNGEYPDLPENFWTSYTSLNEESYWKSIGSIRYLPEGRKTLTNVEPTVLAWQWVVPKEINHKAGILVVVESPEDPINPNNKILKINDLVRVERHVGLKTINILD
jgi:hypothetical protein